MIGNPHKLKNANSKDLLVGGPAEVLDFNAKARLKQLLSDPDPGNPWKLDVPEEYLAEQSPIPSNYWARGLLIELQQFKKVYKKQGFEHYPTAKGYDYSRAGMCVQMKSLKSPADSVVAMKKAIDDLIIHAPSGADMLLHIVSPPGTSASTLNDLKNALLSHRDTKSPAIQARIKDPIIEILTLP
jgi:hypothetical protein